MRIAFTTLGCRLNQFESDALGRMARESGHEVVAPEQADVVVVNTCAITHEADADSRQRVRQVTRRRPGARVVVTGCYASASPEEVAALPGVALVVGNHEKESLIERLARLAPDAPRDAAPVVHVRPADLARRRRVAALRPELAPERSRAYLKIQDGCDYRCSFCIVPSVRGRSASVPAARVAAQLDELVAAGVPEVVLTGVHLGTYGRDLEPRARLDALLTEELIPRLGASRLRLGSLDPHEVSGALIDALERHGGARLCRHLHLPTQSGDDGVLRRMRRAHTSGDLKELTGALARRVPGVALGTDVIVGFPGETDAEFERTRALLESLPLAYLHVFPF
ncbi:MAG: MiaB/RimO family radical SAM methylthiotransferase, partial [Myxococcales bacterium]|nr:MiaB/RimO family radical SAM methylthiotransferase [Myxococcales bacterium]